MVMNRCLLWLATTARNDFRVRGTAVLLTYQGVTGVEHWSTLNVFVQAHMSCWKVRHWCTTLETCHSGALHAHVMLQFHVAVDKTASAFAFEGLKPNISPRDLCGEGLCRKKLQSSIDRGFFYVSALCPTLQENRVCLAITSLSGLSNVAGTRSWEHGPRSCGSREN